MPSGLVVFCEYSFSGHLRRSIAYGLLYYVFTVGIDTGIFPLIIFMGVGALTDFGMKP